MKSIIPVEVFLTSLTRPNRESYDGGGATNKIQYCIKQTSWNWCTLHTRCKCNIMFYHLNHLLHHMMEVVHYFYEHFGGNVEI